MIRDLDDVERNAHEFLAFADGVEEAGHRVYAQRARVVADDLLHVVGELRAERSARVAIQEQRDGFERLASKYATASEAAA